MGNGQTLTVDDTSETSRTWNPGSDFTSSVTTQTTGITVGNPSSNPAISGSIGPGGSRPTDTPAYLVVNYIIKS